MIARFNFNNSILFFIFLVMSAEAQEIALQLYSLRNEMKTEPEKYHQMIANWGIKNLEGGETYGLTTEEYKLLLKKYRLKLIGIGAEYDMLMNQLDSVKLKAKELEVNYVTCYWIPHPEGPLDFDLLIEATALFNKVGKALEKEGIKLLYHPHGYEFSNWNEGFALDYMLENAKYFDFCLDVYWIKMGGSDPVKTMQSHPGKFPLLHLKDREKGTPGSKDGRSNIETNVVLGRGDIDMKGIIQEAKRQKSLYLIIEDESSKSVKQIPQSLEFLRKELSN